jgi:DNA helicase-2/ATP-dependent DNA helicase PcrA
MGPSSSTLSELNPRQREAVLATEGALLVLAGAGAGKTRVITHRILHLMEKGVAPHEILAVTFTNKAAREMRERVRTLIRESAESPLFSRLTYDALPMLTTFHSLGVRILREQHQRLGLRRHFTIYDRSDSNKAIKRALEETGYGTKQFEPRRILSIISRAKGDALSLGAFAESARSYPEEVAAEVWERYDRILREEHALDFDDLLLKTLELLREHDDIEEEYRRRFRYIHIDEYQDTNKVQYAIARTLAGPHANICAVGDIDQSIYSWRGADIANILQFERHFPGARIILLEENYRSTQTIVAASNAVIEKNKNRLEKTVFTSNGQGDPLSLYVAYNETDEAQHVATTARMLVAQGANPSDIAVLFRTNFQSRALEEAFLALSVPYQVLGVRFFERTEIKDMLSYLRLALNPDGTSDLSRVINEPSRGIGKVTLLKMIEKRRDDMNAATLAKVIAFEHLMEDINACAREKPLSQTLRFILTRTGMEASLKKGGEEELERLENIRELVSLSVQYDNLPPEEAAEQLLENAALQSDQDELKDAAEQQNTVKLMTIHAAKGLEFPYVCITGLEEGLFPHERMDGEGKNDDEEERRLFYVALTRAQKKVFLSYTNIRTIFGSQRMNMPSSFLLDLADEHIEYTNPSPMGGLLSQEKTIYID